MGGASSAHPAGNRMAPSLNRSKFVQNNYRMYWALRPEEPDRYYKEKRYDKFRDLPEVSKPVWSFDLAEFTMVLAAAVADHGVHLWDLLMDPPELKVTLRAHQAHVWVVLFTPNELALATGSGDRTIRIWKAENGMPLQVLDAHTEGIRCLAFSMDGLLLSGGMDSQICMWEYDCNVPTAQWKAHDGHVHSIAFVRNRLSENSGLALSVGADGYVAAWYVEQGNHKALGRFRGSGGTAGVLCVAQHTSADNWCACGSEDGAVWVWNFAKLDFDLRTAGSDTQQVETEGSVKLVGHKQGVRTLAFTPDGCLLASGSTDGQIRVWDVRSMHKESREVSCLAVFAAHDSWVTELRFEGGSRGLVTCSSDGFVKHWVAPKRIKKIRGEVPRFSIVIHRLPGFASYGLGVDFKFYKGCLLVCKVGPGLIDEWNKKNPRKVVRPGDLVLGVNDVRKDPRLMLEACKRPETLFMEIKLAEANVYKQSSQPTGFDSLRVKPDHKAEKDEMHDPLSTARHVKEYTLELLDEDVDALEKVHKLFVPKTLEVDDTDDEAGNVGENVLSTQLELSEVGTPRSSVSDNQLETRKKKKDRYRPETTDHSGAGQVLSGTSSQQSPTPMEHAGTPVPSVPGGASIPPPPPPSGTPVSCGTPTLGTTHSWSGRVQGRIDPRSTGQLLQGRLVASPHRHVLPRGFQAQIDRGLTSEAYPSPTSSSAAAVVH